MQTYTGTIAKQVTILPDVVFSAIKLPAGNKPIQLVAFPGKCPNAVIDALSREPGSKISIKGKLKLNNKTRQQEIIVEGAY
jgi:hypothetical protein